MPNAGSPLSGLACYMWHAHKIVLLRLALVCQTINDYVANHENLNFSGIPSFRLHFAASDLR